MREGGVMTLIRGQKESAEILDHLEAMSQKLSEWEKGFIASAQKQISQGKKLSTKQLVVVANIWDRM